MTASSIAHALGLKRAGREYTGACPCCGYKTGFSVTEREGKLLLYCAAGGCEQRDVWATLRKAGLAPEEERRVEPPRKRQRAQKPSEAPTIAVVSGGTDAKDEAVAAIWRRSQPIGGTVAEAYLRARGYTGQIPPSVLRTRLRQTPERRWLPPDARRGRRPRGPARSVRRAAPDLLKAGWQRQGGARASQDDARPVQGWCRAARTGRAGFGSQRRDRIRPILHGFDRDPDVGWVIGARRP